ncbi:outer membrane protein assembly factor BamA [Aestuariirhabdus litorea]|uniref:Outer membrane protein assembly factor BamA n=1 Tax=Aestuariirhabdus litorea TaxID=2528527 RepID=A0A3P3VQN4_9GAMM|nr:outer membrane protein assembly factor BamA [Aestuariirhabdus litorea]RRJ85102.1 outer membrane protein assembly factor BamA [Aestuariirhabdus litorea]RWW98328.1 outer membrane protein assembly factor BamA [Endozoicomonadaceae bacterium GTF-13]
MKRSLLTLLLATLLLPFAGLAQAFLVSDIRINGLQRISAGNAFNALPISVGDEVDGVTVAAATRQLFRTGYFKDIRMDRDGDVLVVTVVERPSISGISISGNKAIETQALLDGLKQSGLAEGEIFQRATLEGIKMELQRQYVAQGRYDAKITTDVRPQPRNRVAISINVGEGSVAAISHVNIVGNSVFDKEELLDLFELKETNWLSFYSSDDKYSREKLSGDLERLRSYYLDRGYLNFNISSTQVSIAPDKERVFITVNVNEGELYRISDVKLAGDLIIPEEQMRSLLQVKAGQTFSHQVMTSTEELITRRLGNEGYTFANVQGIPQPNEEENTVEVTFFVDPGKRAYVRRISFIGNTKTQDEVLRREMRQMEGAWASTFNIEQSKMRLDRLGFFKEVNVETPTVPGSSDQIDVDYSVEEQASGSVSASVGFSTGSGLILGANVQQNNFLGSGNQVNLGLNTSEFQKVYSFGYLNPYYTVDGVSRGFNVFYRTTDYDSTDISNYSTDSIGGSVRFGYPINEITRLGFSFGPEKLHIKTGSSPAFVVDEFVDSEGSNYLNWKAGISWTRSTLNHGLLPTRGNFNSLSAQVAVPGSDTSYYKLNYSGQIFFPLTRKLTLNLKANLGYADAYGDTNVMPFFENYYAGGFGSVRGFSDNSLGPKALSTDGSQDSIGGNILVETTAQVLFPLPFIKDQRSLRTVFFVDAGNAFSDDCERSSVISNCSNVKFSELRMAAGLGLTWITAMGPLSFTLATPIKDESGDDTEVFQFALGQSF